MAQSKQITSPDVKVYAKSKSFAYYDFETLPPFETDWDNERTYTVTGYANATTLYVYGMVDNQESFYRIPESHLGATEINAAHQFTVGTSYQTNFGGVAMWADASQIYLYKSVALNSELGTSYAVTVRAVSHNGQSITSASTLFTHSYSKGNSVFLNPAPIISVTPSYIYLTQYIGLTWLPTVEINGYWHLLRYSLSDGSKNVLGPTNFHASRSITQASSGVYRYDRWNDYLTVLYDSETDGEFLVSWKSISDPNNANKQYTTMSRTNPTKRLTDDAHLFLYEIYRSDAIYQKNPGLWEAAKPCAYRDEETPYFSVQNMAANTRLLSRISNAYAYTYDLQFFTAQFKGKKERFELAGASVVSSAGSTVYNAFELIKFNNANWDANLYFNFQFAPSGEYSILGQYKNASIGIDLIRYSNSNNNTLNIRMSNTNAS